MNHVETTQTMPDMEEVSEWRTRVQHYATLNDQENRLIDLLANAERHRHSVQDHIYRKVREEYESKKVEVDAEKERLEDTLRENLQRFLTAHESALGNSKRQTDRLEEMDFRIRVGEFSEETLAEEREALKQRIVKHTEDLKKIEEILHEFSEAGILHDRAEQLATAPEEEDVAPPREEEVFSPSPVGHQAGNPDPCALSEEPDRDVQEDETSPSTQNPEESTGMTPEDGFLMVEEDSPSTDADCPVVCCPDTISRGTRESAGRTEAFPADPDQDPTLNGYVTGYLVAMEGSRQGDRFPLISSNITLGNSPGIDIRLDDGGISKFHARILYKEKKHYLENLDPMGRSFVNGIQADLVELKDGDVVRLGEIKFQVDYAPSQAH